jgi:hypothetical protein
MDGFTLRVENAIFQRNKDTGFHDCGGPLMPEHSDTDAL